MRMVSSVLMAQPSSVSMPASTRLVMGSESTSTPSQSNSTASKESLSLLREGYG